MKNIIILDKDSPAIVYLCKKDKRLAKIISIIGPISYSPHTNPYPFLIHEIIEQMLSVEAGAKIYGRLQKLCHGNISIDSVISLSDQQIKSIGTSTAKVSYIRNLTTAIKDDVLDFSKLKELSDEEAIEQLISIRGIGSWSAKMFLIFALNRQDILPYEDVAFLQSFQWLYKTNSRSKEIV